MLVQVIFFLVLATVVGYACSSSFDFELFKSTLGRMPIILQGIVVTCYILGILALGQCVVKRCMMHGHPEGQILSRMRETGNRRRTWLARGRNWRDHSCDCCDCCPGYYDSLLLYWALSHQSQLGASCPSSCTCFDAGCCACDDCFFAATVGVGCEGLPFDCHACCGEEDSITCCAFVVAGAILTFAGAAVAFSFAFFAELHNRVRICIARSCPVTEAGATLEGKVAQALSQLKVQPKTATHTQYAVRDGEGAVPADVVGTPVGTFPASDAA